MFTASKSSVEVRPNLELIPPLFAQIPMPELCNLIRKPISGTHPKHKEKLDIYRRLNLSILSEISIDQAVEKGLIAPYKINVVECELDRLNKNVKSGNSTKVFYQTEQEKYDYLTKLASNFNYEPQFESQKDLKAYRVSLQKKNLFNQVVKDGKRYLEFTDAKF